jgi:phosphopantetheine adenylyltransferase
MSNNPNIQAHLLDEILYSFRSGNDFTYHYTMNKANNKITKLRTILQRESQNS